MRRRTTQSDASPLDALMDVLSNIIGIVILIAVVAALNTKSLQFTLANPIVKQAPENATRLSFEIRHGRIVPVDEEQLVSIVDDKIAALARQNGTAFVDDLMAVINGGNFGTKHHRIELTQAGPNNVNQLWKIRSPEQGEDAVALRKPRCRFSQQLERLDPMSTYVYFNVFGGDGFETLKAARNIARELGFASGWCPHASSSEFGIFANGGANVPSGIMD